MSTRRRPVLMDAELQLLDRQILDEDDKPVVVVSDVELSDIQFDEPIAAGTKAPVITALLSGPVLVTRIFGGKPPRSRLHTVPWQAVSKIDTVISLGIKGDSLDVTWAERWISQHIIQKIPGGKHDPE